jgi:DNA repair photolyase
MNIYRGCPHGCIYCDSRSDCYQTEDFDRVRVKADALRVIRDDLRRKVKPGVVATGSMSDPYNPCEAGLRLTRNAMELLSAYGFGVAVATKSDLVLRDIDVLTEIKAHSPVLVKVTVTTPHDALSAKIEPHAPPSSRRLEVLRGLSGSGIFCGVLLMPVLPFLEDSPGDIVRLVQLAGAAGANFIYPAFGMTQRQGQREYFHAALDRLFPGMKEKYLRQYGSDYRCTAPTAGKLWDIFKKECDACGLLYRMPDIIAGYKMGYQESQLSWF